MADGSVEVRADSLARQAMRTPRAAAVAGIAFSLLFTTAMVLVRLAVPSDPEDAGSWLTSEGKRDAVVLALNLLPFAGIAFLWFIGVVRDRIGQGEDRLFATVFLGSGLLFIAMLFATGAIAGGLVLTAGERPAPGVWSFGRRVSFTLLTVYAMRMAAVFTISTTTIATRLGLAPTMADRARPGNRRHPPVERRCRPVDRDRLPGMGPCVQRAHPGGLVPLEHDRNPRCSRSCEFCPMSESRRMSTRSVVELERRTYQGGDRCVRRACVR